MTMKIGEGEAEDDGDNVFELGEGNVGSGAQRCPKPMLVGAQRCPKPLLVSA